MMPTIDRWVISTVIELLRPRRELLANAPVVFTINFSGQSLTDEEFADYVIRSIENSRINPGGVLLRAHRKRRGRQHEGCARP